MTALGEWLKQLILLVLLATLADLLLPTQAMQRYMRMVLGLAVIAALLQPVVPLLRHDWADQLAQAAWLETVPPESTNMPATAALAGLMNRQQQADENVYADAALKAQIESLFSVPVRSVGIVGTGQSGSPIRVEVAVESASSAMLAAIRKAVASLLRLPQGRVTIIGSNGGVLHGP